MKNALLVICIFFLTIACYGQRAGSDTTAAEFHKHFWATGMNAGILSTAFIQHVSNSPYDPPASNTTGTLRFSYLANLGITFNYNFSQHVGAFTGIYLKNIGYIDKYSGYTRKVRTYNVGIPLGIKLGNMNSGKPYGFAGGGADVAVNYKEKMYTERKNKTKFSEWFSDRTPLIMPYVFAGFCYRGVAIKAQYYPGNFVNSSYTYMSGTNIVQPFRNTTVHLLLFTIGFPNLLQHLKKASHAPLS